MKYFKFNEFDSPDQPGSGYLMDPSFLQLLDKIRESAGIPFIINSGYRTPRHNEEEGGKSNSAHLRGLAVDIRAVSGIAKFKIMQAAIFCGVNRIGIGKHFIHIDIDTTLPNPTIWLY